MVGHHSFLAQAYSPNAMQLSHKHLLHSLGFIAVLGCRTGQHGDRKQAGVLKRITF